MEQALGQGARLWAAPREPGPGGRVQPPPYIEFVLPYDLLNHDVAGLTHRIGEGRPLRLGLKYGVHLRSLERMRSSDALAREQWRERWRTLREHGVTVHGWSEPDGGRLDAWQAVLAGENRHTAVVLDAPADRLALEALKAAIAEGIGLAVWDRRGVFDEERREVVTAVFAAVPTPAQIPTAIHRLRQKAETHAQGPEPAPRPSHRFLLGRPHPTRRHRPRRSRRRGGTGMSAHERTSPNGWRVFHATGHAPAVPPRLPEPPPWRRFRGDPLQPTPPDDPEAALRRLGPGDLTPQLGQDEIDTVNAALLLRRPLLITGPPGVGKSTLAYLISRELGLGRVLEWNIVSRTSLRDGLYVHDAMGRAQAIAAWQAGLRDAGATAAEGDVLAEDVNTALSSRDRQLRRSSATSSPWAPRHRPAALRSSPCASRRRARQERHRPAERPVARPGEREAMTSRSWCATPRTPHACTPATPAATPSNMLNEYSRSSRAWPPGSPVCTRAVSAASRTSSGIS